MSEIISHVLEPVVKTMTGGLEQESSSDMMALMNEINDENHEIEDIDLESVDEELEDQERRAEERYNNFDLPTGWKPQTENPHPEDWKSQSDFPLPEGWKAGDTSTSVTATCGSVSNRVVLNSEVENIDLQNSHAGGKSEERWSLEEDDTLPEGWRVRDDTLPEGWKYDQDKAGGEGGVNTPTGSWSNKVLKGNTRHEVDNKYGVNDGQDSVSKVNTIDKTYQKSINANKKQIK